ncbi:MAG: cytochrome c biogenesis CcdA family protein, partial [Promethearchaeota archaeon]
MLAIDPSLYFTALGAGIISFISPCNAALLPTFISYIGSAAKNRKQSVIISVLYALGFSITFGVLGVIFLAGLMSLENRRYFNLLAGIITILLALYLIFSKYVDKGFRAIKVKLQRVISKPISSNHTFENVENMEN